MNKSKARLTGVLDIYAEFHNQTMIPKKTQHYSVIILGGGFCGIGVAKKLSKVLPKDSVALIDKKDYFDYIPGSPRQLTAKKNSLEFSSRTLYKSILPNCSIIQSSVTEINDRFVNTKVNNYSYDYLVCCTGISPALPSFARNNSKSLHVFTPTTSAQTCELGKKISNNNYESIAVIGGGFVGVEIAAELATKTSSKVVLLEPNERLLCRGLNSTSLKAARFLEKKGCILQFGKRVKDIKKNLIHCEDGSTYPASVIAWCAGISTKENSALFGKEFSLEVSDRGILVNECLQLINHPQVYCGGDLAVVPEEKTAQNAEEHAKVIYHNILTQLGYHKNLMRYKTAQTLMLIGLGDYRAILTSKNISWYGRVPALLKWLVEKWTLWKIRH